MRCLFSLDEMQERASDMISDAPFPSMMATECQNEVGSEYARRAAQEQRMPRREELPVICAPADGWPEAKVATRGRCFSI